MYDYDPNETVDCSPIQDKKKRQRHQKTLNHRSRRKLDQDKNASECSIDPSYSISKENLFLKEQCGDDNVEPEPNFNILSEVYTMSRADMLPSIQTSKNMDCSDFDIFLTASQFRDKVVLSNTVEADSNSPKVEILEMSNKFVDYEKISKNEFYVDIYKDFTELEDENYSSANETNLSPPPFRYKRKNLRKYNGPNFEENLTNNSKKWIEKKIDSKASTTPELNSTKLNGSCSHSSNAESQNISKNILNLSFTFLNPSNLSMDSLNFENQNSLESEQITDFKINEQVCLNSPLKSKHLFESFDDECEISDLEDKILININNSNEELIETSGMKNPLRSSQSSNEVQQCELKDTKIRKSINCNIEKSIFKTKLTLENLSVSKTVVENIAPIRKSLRLANSKFKKNKNITSDNDTQDSQYLTPTGEFLNKSNERQLLIREKMTRISFIFNQDDQEDSDDEDFRGFDLNNLSTEDKELYEEYKEKSTQNILNKYLEEDLEVFDAIDESHYTTHNIIIEGETQSLLNDSFMDCPNVLRDVDILLNRNECNQPTKKCNKIDNNGFDSELWSDEDIFKDLKTQNFINYNFAETIKENLNKDDADNFKTPTRLPLKTNFNDVQRLNDEKVNSGQLINIPKQVTFGQVNIPKLVGFKTGSGKSISISSEALKKATNFITETLNEDDLEEISDGKENVFQKKQKVDDKASISDIGLDSDKSFRISDNENCRKSEFLKDKNDNNSLKSTDLPKFEGFKCGNGKAIKISSESYKKAAAFMAHTVGEIEANESLEKEFEDNLFDKHLNHQVPNKYPGSGIENSFQIQTEQEGNKPHSFSGFRFVTSDETTSKRKIEEIYELPGKVIKCNSIENSLRKQQLDNCIKIKPNYELALSIGKPSTSKLPSSKATCFNTPEANAVKRNFYKTPSTPCDNETLNKISTPNLADFTNSVINNNNKSTPQPGLFPLRSNKINFDDLIPLNNTTNSDLDNSNTTPKRSGPSPKMRIEYLEKMHPKPPDLSPGCFMNDCKPSGLRKRSRLSFSKNNRIGD